MQCKYLSLLCDLTGYDCLDLVICVYGTVNVNIINHKLKQHCY